MKIFLNHSSDSNLNLMISEHFRLPVVIVFIPFLVLTAGFVLKDATMSFNEKARHPCILLERVPFGVSFNSNRFQES